MKNLIINAFKTLFFFDLAVVILYYLPELSASSNALAALYNEALRFMILAVLTFVYLRYVEKKKLTLSTGKTKFKHIITGIGAGLSLPAVVVAVMLLLKNITFSGVNKINYLYFWIPALLLNAIAGELLYRGYLFKLYKKHYGFLVAAVITTLLFTINNLEIFEKGAVFAANIILLNILLCLLLEFTGSVAVNITARFIYTFLSTFMLGSLNLPIEYPTFLKVAFSGNTLLGGGENRLEGSVILLLLSSVIVVLLLNKKYKLIPLIKAAILSIKGWLQNLNKIKVPFKKNK